jgi:hypothetical protein
MYGNGSGTENAYILVYRQKKMCQELAQNKNAPSIPEYWKTFVDELNTENQYQRVRYQKLENQIDVFF